MWANWEVHDFVEWLASDDEGLDTSDATGFFGLDAYGLFESMVALIAALADIDPDAAAAAREAYRCFEP